ncbi:MAG: response regulator [Planctomycetes bacterium]|nr:response regulator [Planctomycetota bacterium]
MSDYRVLVVDDEEDTLELYRQFLELSEEIMLTESSPRKALEHLRRDSWDLLICDIKMPEIDGFEVIRCGMDFNPGIRCIAVTGYGSEQILQDVFELDCFGYINKPFDWNYLKLLVKKALQPKVVPAKRSGRMTKKHRKSTVKKKQTPPESL